MISFLATNLSLPSNSNPCLFNVASSFKISITSRLCLSPINLSFKSCAGVTFKHPVPKSIST